MILIYRTIALNLCDIQDECKARHYVRSIAKDRIMQNQCPAATTSAAFGLPAPGSAKLPARPPHRWKVLGVGVVANISFSAAAAGIPTTAVWLRADYRFGNTELGLVLGALGLGVAVSELPWGMATDRWGDRRVLMTGLLATALALLAMALFVVPSATSVPALGWVAAAMAGVGLLGGSVNGSSGRAVMRWFQEGERGFAMSVRQTAVPLGGGVGALLLPSLAASVGFAWVYGALALLCGVSVLMAWRWLHEPPDFAAGPGKAHPRHPGPLRNAALWRMVWGIGILCVPQFAILTFATVFLHDVAHLGVAGIAGSMAAIQLGAAVTRLWSGRLTDRRGERRGFLRVAALIAVGAFVALAAVTLYGQSAPVAAMVAAVVLAGICVSAWHGVAYTELATMAGTDHAGTALGMANTTVYLGFFVTPLAIAHLLARTSWSSVWLAAGLCGLLAYPLFPRPAACPRIAR
jgi:MFS family permease